MPIYRGLTPLYHSVLVVKALVGAFNQEKAQVVAFSVIVKTLPLFRLQLYVARRLAAAGGG